MHFRSGLIFLTVNNSYTNVCRKLSTSSTDVIGVYFTYMGDIEYQLWDRYTGMKISMYSEKPPFNDIVQYSEVSSMTICPYKLADKNYLFDLISVEHIDYRSIRSLFQIELPAIITNLDVGNKTRILSTNVRNERLFDYSIQSEILLSSIFANSLSSSTIDDNLLAKLGEQMSDINRSINNKLLTEINWIEISNTVNNLIQSPNYTQLNDDAQSMNVILLTSESSVKIGNRIYSISNPDFTGLNSYTINYIIEYLQAVIDGGDLKYIDMQNAAIKYAASK